MTGKRSALSIQLTERCNLACDYCYVMARESRDLADCTDALCAEFVDFALRQPGDEVKLTFFGGEPLLRPDLIRHTVALARKAAAERGKSVRFHLVTNGVLLDDATGDFLASERIGLEISIDGPEEVHDRHRRFPDGTGSFRQVYGNLLRFVERHPDHPVDLFAVLASPDGVPWLRALARSIDAAGLTLNPLHAVGDASRFRKAGSVRDALDREALRRAAAVLEGRAELDEALKSRASALLGMHGSHRCAAGFDASLVTRTGEIWPCPLFVGLEGQAIGDLRRGFDPDRVEAFARRNLHMPPGCPECEAEGLCGGGCAFVSHLRRDLSGKPGSDDCASARRHARAFEPSAIALAARFPERFLEKPAARPAPAPRRIAVPQSFVVRLTGRCNLACDYCYDRGLGAPEADMSTATAQTVADYILGSASPAPVVCLFGGECLLNWETGRFLIEAVANGAAALGKTPSFTIATNGTLISREIAEVLARHDATVQLSVDGGREGHDRHRRYRDGRGSYDDLVRGLDRLRAVLPEARVDAKVVLTPKNLDLEKIVVSLEPLGIRRISFVAGAWGESTGVSWTLPDIRRLAEAREAFFPFYLRSAIRGRADIDMRLAGLIAAEPAGARGGCECGGGEVHIDAAGAIHMCPQLYAAGRGRLGDCGSAGRGPEGLPLPPGDPPGPDCLACWAYPRCGGGCKVLNHRCPWSPSSLPPGEQAAWCDLMRAEFGRSILAYRHLKARHPRSLDALASIFEASR